MKQWDNQVRQQAIDLFDQGLGYRAAARRLEVPVSTVKCWACEYKSVGRERMLSNKRENYPFDVRVAVAREHSEEGKSVADVMVQYGIASRTLVLRWSRAYKEGGAEALRPKRRGRKPKQKAE